MTTWVGRSLSASAAGESSRETQHEVLVLPSGITLHVRDGETIFAAAMRSDVEWPTRCFGRASCRQCYFELSEDSGGLSDVARLEADALARIVLPKPEPGWRRRLACQARILGDLVVHRAGVHPGRTN